MGAATGGVWKLAERRAHLGGRSSTNSPSTPSARSRSSSPTRTSSGWAPGRATRATARRWATASTARWTAGRTWKHVGLEQHGAHPSPAPPPHEPRRGLRVCPRPGVGREPRPRRLQDGRRRQDLVEGALRRREDRLRRPGDGPEKPREALRGDLAVPALALVLQVGRAGLGSPRHPRRRRHLEAPDRGRRPAQGRARADRRRHRCPAARRSSTRWSRRTRTSSCARRTAGRSFKVANERTDVSPRPFYYADIRVDPERPDRVYRLATQLSRLERRRQDLRDPRRHRPTPDPRGLPRDVDRSAGRPPPLRRQRRRHGGEP